MRFVLKAIQKLIVFCVAFALSVGAGIGLYMVSLLPSLPNIEQIHQVPLNIPLRIYTRDHKLIAEYGEERRIPITLEQAPPLLVDAVLAAEDMRFYQHSGVDFIGLVRAAINNFRSKSRRQGASTITMQVARNFFLNPEKTYIRKLKEVLLAFNLERVLSKDEILQLYLNKIFLGHRAYGFATAAQVYYGRELYELSVPEVAMLAGLPKAPSRDNPISNPKRAKQRRDYVLRRLHETGKIDALTYANAGRAPLTAYQHLIKVDFQAPFVAEMARQTLFEHLGEAAYQNGYKVITTIDSRHQISADLALRKGLYDYDVRHGYRGALARLDLDTLDESALIQALQTYPSSRELRAAVVTSVGEKHFSALMLTPPRGQQSVDIQWQNLKWARPYISANAVGAAPARAAAVVQVGDVVYVKPTAATGDAEQEWQLSQLPKVSGALVGLNSRSGAILALSGGFDYYLSKFNRAAQALRQPGSNIKPFIYSAALDNGFTPISLVSAAPIVVTDDIEGIWRPQNYSKKFFGPTPLRQALSRSLNLVSVRLLRAIGIDQTITHLQRIGFDREKLPRNLSLALGSTTLTPLDLAARYATIANGGIRIQPYLIDKVEDQQGEQLDLVELGIRSRAVQTAIEQAAVYTAHNPRAVSMVDNLANDLATLNTTSTAESSKTQPRNAAAYPRANDVEPGQRAISEQNAFLTRSLMRQVILSGTGRKALSLNRGDLAGKTGTTNDFKDAWFSGFIPELAATVYIGFDEPAHLGLRESGARAALPVWIDYMREVLPDFSEQPTIPPHGITTRLINKDSGKVTHLEDPAGYLEYFLADNAPDFTLETGASINGQVDDRATSGGGRAESLF